MELFVIFAMFFIIIEGSFTDSIKWLSANKKKLILSIIFFIQLFIPAGLRSVSVYNDSLSYASHFQVISPDSLFDINFLERFEIGYQFLENFIYLYLSKEPLALFFITSFFIQSSFMILFYRYSKNIWFSVFLFFGLTHYFFVVSGIRQGLAIAIFNFAIPYLLAKRWVPYYLLILLSAQFHSSAYILLLIPIFYHIKLTYKRVFLFLAFIVGFYFFLDKILEVFFSFFPNYGIDYTSKERISESKTGGILILITYVIGFLFVNKKINLNSENKESNVMMFFYLALIMFLVLSLKFSILIRFTHYFMPFSIILLSNSICEIKNIMNRFVSYLFWVLFLIVQIYVILSYKPEWFMVIPYKFYWE